LYFHCFHIIIEPFSLLIYFEIFIIYYIDAIIIYFHYISLDYFHTIIYFHS